METTKQVVSMKCPHCGWVRKIELDVEDGRASAVMGAGVKDFFKGLPAFWQDKIKALIKDRQLDETNDWLPMPNCPHCDKPYEYNVRTGQTR